MTLIGFSLVTTGIKLANLYEERKWLTQNKVVDHLNVKVQLPLVVTHLHLFFAFDPSPGEW